MFNYLSLLLVILCLCVGCDKPNKSSEQTKNVEPKPQMKEKKVELTTISQGANSGHNEKKDYTITNEDDWKKLWAQVHANVEPKPELPKVDFGKEIVIAAFKGQHSSGGHSITITEAMIKSDGCTVQIKEVSPDPGGMMSMGFSQPYHIVKTPKIEQKVTFKHMP
ncbi:protease complex subunit PrcB family protein [Candidatus Uabimicrobium sp. HlEnr_7]|uniref:protease complex subunit PrcB family protein n=1 Tax=Candidatus Uabimicrobium helgolandensis TaxID=3095367 RepID=UPI003555C3D2